MLNFAGLDYPALAALAAVLRTGSFERAAAELKVTPSAVSQRIKTLEERLGTTLVVRGQPCTGTPAGTRIARHVAEVGLLEATLAADLGQAPPGGPRPPLRIAVNADSLDTWVIPALAEVDGLLFDLVVDDQEHSADWLRRGEVTAAVTARPQPVQGCDAIALGRLCYVATASPAFMTRWFPNGPSAEALSTAPALAFNAKDRLQSDWAARVAGAPVSLPTHFLPSTAGFVEAVLLSVGWGLNPEPLVRQHLSDGRLIALSSETLDTPLYWQVSRLAAPGLQALTKAIKRAARRNLAR